MSSDIFCPYCGEAVDIIEAWHASGGWDIIKAECDEHKWLEIEVECYNECVENILDEDKLAKVSISGTKLDG